MVIFFVFWGAQRYDTAALNTNTNGLDISPSVLLIRVYCNLRAASSYESSHLQQYVFFLLKR